jgi:hypothetical protein
VESSAHRLHRYIARLFPHSTISFFLTDKKIIEKQYHFFRVRAIIKWMSRLNSFLVRVVRAIIKWMSRFQKVLHASDTCPHPNDRHAPSIQVSSIFWW